MNKSKKPKNKDSQKEKINIVDIFQILVGSLAAAIVFAPTEELWLISQNLPIYKIIIIILLTLIFTTMIAYWIGGRKLKLHDISVIAYIIPIRIVIIYFISLFSCFIALWIYDILSTFSSSEGIIRGIIVLSLPSTWGGALLDLVYSKNK